ncbi:MAG: adenosylmethionine decarboxylase [Proteobacteria bacterium]|nr:adenosylmethionine decarboxylase [Pseudomonadota bacterium]
MTQQLDHFKQTSDGQSYAGDHLLIEFWGAKNLTNVDTIREALEAGATAAGATILHSHYHRFGDGGGVSGVTVLSESHISIHTWPERSYAAIDVFMCGDCDPKDCLPELEKRLHPEQVDVQLFLRGCDRTDAKILEVA